MTVKEWITLLFGSGILVTAWGYLYGKIQAVKKENDAIRLGVQALLRDQLIEKYDKYSDKGYAPIYARENFENMWMQYHNLGVNGVMDVIHDKFMELPTEKRGDFDHE